MIIVTVPYFQYLSWTFAYKVVSVWYNLLCCFISLAKRQRQGFWQKYYHHSNRDAGAALPWCVEIFEVFSFPFKAADRGQKRERQEIGGVLPRAQRQPCTWRDSAPAVCLQFPFVLIAAAVPMWVADKGTKTEYQSEPLTKEESCFGM